MVQNKTRKTGACVEEFLMSVENKRRREDGLTLLGMMKEITGLEPEMWGPSIIGFVRLPLQVRIRQGRRYISDGIFSEEAEFVAVRHGRIRWAGTSF